MDKCLESLYKLIGAEVHLEDTMQVLNFAVKELRPPVIGALQVTCSDECERECCDVFQRRFAQHVLPSLKFGSHSPFRTATIGGRYEWSSIRIAENHFAQATKGPFKALVVKINSHVSVVKASEGPVYGTMVRYHHTSHFCGALQSLLEGSDQPFGDELHAEFISEGKDRLKIIVDPEQVDPRLKNLFAAIVNARLQARKVVIDIQDYQPLNPTIYLVLACVTLNRYSQRDTEIVCGVYGADFRSEPPFVTYRGLGDDPATYRVQEGLNRLQVWDGQIQTSRQARDHRRLILTEWRKQEKKPPSEDPRIKEIQTRVEKGKHPLQPYAGTILKSLLAVLLELSPIPAAVLLFSEGLIDIRHTYRLHKMSRQVDHDAEARQILLEFYRKVDSLPPARAQKVIDVLLNAYGKK